MIIIITGAEKIQRDDNGTAWTWQGGSTHATFSNGDGFVDYVKENIDQLGADCVAFCGSASQIQAANQIIAQELKKAGKL